MNHWIEPLKKLVGAEHVLTGEGITADYTHDESLNVAPSAPDALVRPQGAEEVAAVLALANEHGVPVTARGNGTGLSGACIPTSGGILMTMERMNQVLEVDTANHVAVIQPGVTLAELDEALQPQGLIYPILPGESSATLGGNVATNAGGMRAVKYGVTRNNVLGLEVALPTGEVLRTGGRFVKASSGFDLTQLIIGSEGLLGVVTEITVKLVPRFTDKATVLVPFATLDEVMEAVPALVRSGVGPLMLEYIDIMTMAATTGAVGLELGIPEAIKEKALAYLVVVLEARSAQRLQEDVEAVGEQAVELGAMDVFVLPPQAGTRLMEAREQAYWVAKKAGTNEVVDVVVPRAAMPAYMKRVSELATEQQTLVVGCGHAGDGNVHLSIFQPDAQIRQKVMHGIFSVGMEMGGMISAEHGIGKEKKKYFQQLEDPAKLALLKRIKQAFDPKGILNPGTLLD